MQSTCDRPPKAPHLGALTPWAFAASLVAAAPHASAQTYDVIAPGVEYAAHQHLGYDVFVVRVDLCAAGVRMRATRPDEAFAGGNVTSSAKTYRTPQGFAQLVPDSVAVVNGDFFDGTAVGPEGIAVGESAPFAGYPGGVPRANHGTVGFGISRTVMTANAAAGSFPLLENTQWLRQAVGGAPMLAAMGQPLNYTPEAQCAKNPRTMVGLSVDRRTAYLVVNEGRNNVGQGITCNEAGPLMVGLGASEALNLDGGGSSAMWVTGKGTVSDYPQGQSPRPVANHLAVFAAGSGPAEHCPCDVDALGRIAADSSGATAAAISEAFFPAGAATVVLVPEGSGQPSPEGVFAAPLASQLGAPILLAGQTLPSETQTEIERLGASEVIVLGGEAVVSAAAVDALAIPYERLAGADRYTTAVTVAERVDASHGLRTLFVASGLDNHLVDAVTAGPVAAAMNAAVVLVGETIPSPVSGLLGKLAGLEEIIVVGGEGAVPQALVDKLAGLAPTASLERIAGGTRADTAARIADFAHSRCLLDGSEVFLAKADGSHAEAIAAAAVARSTLLTSTTLLSPESDAYLRTHATAATILGGRAAVDEVAEGQICQALLAAEPMPPGPCPPDEGEGGGDPGDATGGGGASSLPEDGDSLSPAAGDDAGCSCRAAGSRGKAPLLWPWLGIALGGVMWRRARGSHRLGSMRS